MTLEELGAIAGLVAFCGLAVLTFMTFQQARDVRRLRDWAGRAPERAAAVAARAGEETLPAEAYEEEELEIEREPGRLSQMRGSVSDRWAELDRRMPVEPKIVLGGLAAIVFGIGIAIGFGGGGEDSGSGETGGDQATPPVEKPIKVAVLNATSPAVVGLANQLSKDVKQAGFRVGQVENASPIAVSVVMFKADAKADAREVAQELEPVLGPSQVIEMTPEVEDKIGGIDVAVVIGADDAGI